MSHVSMTCSQDKHELGENLKGYVYYKENVFETKQQRDDGEKSEH